MCLMANEVGEQKGVGEADLITLTSKVLHPPGCTLFTEFQVLSIAASCAHGILSEAHNVFLNQLHVPLLQTNLFCRTHHSWFILIYMYMKSFEKACEKFISNWILIRSARDGGHEVGQLLDQRIPYLPAFRRAAINVLAHLFSCCPDNF